MTTASPRAVEVGPTDLDDLLRVEEKDPGLAIRVVHQPIVDLARGVVVGYEALSRFPAPVASPEPWFDLARRTGRHGQLEAATLRAAITSHGRLPRNTFLTVNLGPDVLTDPVVRDVLGEHSSLAGVVVELTEHTRIDSMLELEPTLDELRGRGALLAIDDVGAGYSGLQHLLALRPEFIKLDRSLVDGVDRDEAKRALVEMVGTFASRIDAWLLAEGVETTEQLDVLLDLQVPLAQGYLLGRPAHGFTGLPAGVAERLLTERVPVTPSNSLRDLLEHAPVASSTSAAAAALASSTSVDLVVVLDRHGSPVATLDGAGITHAIRDTGLRVNVDTPLRQAAQRAIGRPQGSRFHPLVCTDNAGRYVGVVKMERLVDRLSR